MSHSRMLEVAQYFLRQAQVYMLEFRTWQHRTDTDHLFWALDSARCRLAMARNWFRMAGTL